MTPLEAKKSYGASHYMPMKDGVTPQMYYRKKAIGFADGDSKIVWHYLSYANLWMGSELKDDSKLIAIESVSEFTIPLTSTK